MNNIQCKRGCGIRKNKPILLRYISIYSGLLFSRIVTRKNKQLLVINRYDSKIRCVCSYRLMI